MKKLLLTTFAAALCLAAGAQDHIPGYYKDIFMDSGIMLTSRTDLPVTELLGLSMEAFVSGNSSPAPPSTRTASSSIPTGRRASGWSI